MQPTALGGGVTLREYPIDLHAADARHHTVGGVLDDEGGKPRAHGLDRKVAQLPRVGGRVGDLVEKSMDGGGTVAKGGKDEGDKVTVKALDD